MKEKSHAHSGRCCRPSGAQKGSQLQCAGRGKAWRLRLVHGVQNALRQGVRLLFMGQVAQALKTAYQRFSLSRE